MERFTLDQLCLDDNTQLRWVMERVRMMLGRVADPVTEPDVIDPGVGTPVPGQEPDVPGMPSGPMVA